MWKRLEGFGIRCRGRVGLVGCSVVLLAAQPVLGTAPGREEVIRDIRQLLEEPFLDSGGFLTFDCELPPEGAPPREFTCVSQDRASNHYRYLLVPKDEQLIVDLVTEPASQLDYPWMDPLESVCREWVDHYDRGAWVEMYSGLRPELQQVVDVDSLDSMLTPLRDPLGKVEAVELVSYSKHSSGRHELEFRLRSQGGEASFRCGLFLEREPEDSMDGGIIAFLLTPARGTEVYEQMFEAQGISLLSVALGMELARFEIPFDQLVKQYDVAEGAAWLNSGQEFRVRVELTGREDDFSESEFGFQVLDVPLFLTTYLRSQGMEPVEFHCPSRVVEDGATLDCTVDLEGGDTMAFTVARRGGDHRLLSLEKAAP